MTREPPHPGVVWRTLMEETGRTQADVSRAMGVSPKHLNQILQGEALPSAGTTLAFAHAVGASSRLMWQLVSDYKLADAERGES